MCELKIINPIIGKGIFDGRKYLSRKKIKDESNYVELALVIKDENGKFDKTQRVEIIATDDKQNKIHNGAGSLVTIQHKGRGQSKKQAFGYPFHYEFNTPGVHKIEFRVPNLSKSATTTIVVEEDKR